MQIKPTKVNKKEGFWRNKTVQGLVNEQCVFILGGIYSMANNAMRTFHTDGTKLELLVRESTSLMSKKTLRDI